MALVTLTTFSLDTSTPQFSSPPVKVRPFLIQGATTGIPPANPERVNILHTKNQNTPFYSTTPSEYDSEQVTTKNIIFPDYCTGTTLVDMVEKGSPRYEFSFAAIHTNDLNTTSDKHEIEYVVSIVFNNSVNVYHIQVPLVISSSIQPSDVNPFLQCWLDPSVVSKESFSINQLLQFKQEGSIEFDRFIYQQKYNQESTASVAKTTGISTFLGNYTLCILKTPHFILNYPSLTENYLSSFNDVFNYMQYTSMKIANPRYPLERSGDMYMLANSSSKYPTATFYTIPRQELSKLKLSEGFTSCASPETQLLDKVKCYPIDLATQVDANGDILIDKLTSKPIDARPMSSIPAKVVVPEGPAFNYTGLIIVIVVFIVALLLIVIIIYLLFRSSSSGPGAGAAPAPAPAAVAAAAPAPGAGSAAGT
jgi:hypothetical protein